MPSTTPRLWDDHIAILPEDPPLAPWDVCEGLVRAVAPGTYLVRRVCRHCGGEAVTDRGCCPECHGDGCADYQVSHLELTEAEQDAAIARGLMPCVECGEAYAAAGGDTCPACVRAE